MTPLHLKGESVNNQLKKQKQKTNNKQTNKKKRKRKMNRDICILDRINPAVYFPPDGIGPEYVKTVS